MIFTGQAQQYGHDYKSRVLQLKPYLYYDMDEASGSVLVNRGMLGPSFNATISGTPTYQDASLVRDNGYGMTFTGSPNYASIASSASIGDALGVHTIGCWAKWTYRAWFATWPTSFQRWAIICRSRRRSRKSASSWRCCSLK